MDKVVAVLMILLFVVAMTKNTLFDSNGITKDVSDTKSSTQTVIQNANTQMKNLP
ncbi:hypothetical protein [Gottfriedia solisilvae]|uniref:hypothetical protein n=1 Tax=Gottfriedia solisilvae TaxID=1516104 RepID=UPI003D2EC3D7